MNDGELPHFDVVHLGIGPDAHTASLFPGEPLIEDRAGTWRQPSMSRRSRSGVSRFLPGVLLAARNMAVLAAGADKKEALEINPQRSVCPATITQLRLSRGRRESRSSFSTRRRAVRAGSLIRHHWFLCRRALPGNVSWTSWLADNRNTPNHGYVLVLRGSTCYISRIER